MLTQMQYKYKYKYKVMEVITKKQIPAILRKIAGRASGDNGLKWQISIGKHYDGANRLTVMVSDKDYNSKTVYDAIITEDRKASILRSDRIIAKNLNEWFSEKTKKMNSHGDE